MAGALSESAPRPVSVVRVVAGELQSNVVVAEPASNPVCVDTESLEQQLTAVTTATSPATIVAESSQAPQQTSSNGQVRSFASTEAQTEHSPSLLLHRPRPTISHNGLLSEELRDVRRRERRMRRQHRRAIQRVNGAAAVAAAAAAVNAASGLPPTYSGPGAPAVCAGAGPLAAPPPSGASVLGTVAGGVPLVPTVSGFLHPPPPHLGFRGLSLGLPFPVPASVSAYDRDAVPKQCCGLGSPPVRWSILGVGIVGLVCAGAGALLGALRATGRDHIAVALLMIGIGVVLVTVSAVAWRVTSRENCASFFGLTGISSGMPPARPIQPYTAMIYPEYQFRTPPPSYTASMQEYRLRLLLLDRLHPASSPPPTYRSNAGSCIARNETTSNPAAICGPPAAAVTGATATCSSRASAGTSRPPIYYGSHHHRGSIVVGSGVLPLASKKDANLVRIVQTESEPVILCGDQTPPVTAVEVLAHL